VCGATIATRAIGLTPTSSTDRPRERWERNGENASRSMDAARVIDATDATDATRAIDRAE
jgi:hypothetical protein